MTDRRAGSGVGFDFDELALERDGGPHQLTAGDVPVRGRRAMARCRATASS